jgi:hypothetical protein
MTAGPKFQLTLFLSTLLVPLHSHAATLKADTVSAWDDYVRSVRTAMQDRLHPGGCFLWTDEDPERVSQVHAGEIMVSPASTQNPKKVPGGLIHHWIGAAFLPDTKLADMLQIIQDYDRYKQYYRPFVLESKTVARNARDDRFSMLLMNRSLVPRTALDADYRATEVNLDDHRLYSVSETTRVQEVDDYGQPGEHRLPEGEGRGYVWKLFSISRLEQRDGGVYIEMETVALSRDIPALVRFVVDPIVRRISRNSMVLSIKQTEQAVHSNAFAASQHAVPTQ